MTTTVIAARASHALTLAPLLRASDLDEMWAEAGLQPESAHMVLSECIRISVKAWAVVVDDEPIVLFGVAPDYRYGDPRGGQAWLVASPDILQHSSFVLRNSRKYIDEMHQQFPRLYNWVDDRNVATHRWLKWCGFKASARDPQHGYGRLPFTLFEKI